MPHCTAHVCFCRTCVLCVQPDWIIGRMGRSMRRDTRTSWSCTAQHSTAARVGACGRAALCRGVRAGSSTWPHLNAAPSSQQPPTPLAATHLGLALALQKAARGAPSGREALGVVYLQRRKEPHNWVLLCLSCVAAARSDASDAGSRVTSSQTPSGHTPAAVQSCRRRCCPRRHKRWCTGSVGARSGQVQAA